MVAPERPTPTRSSSDALSSDVEDWIRAVTGAAQVVAERRAGGASREGWAVDVTPAAEDEPVRQLWLRLDAGAGPQSATPYTLRREAQVYRALAATPVPVPHVVAVHPEREVFLATRVPGRTWFAEITDPAEQVAVASDFMAHLAELHRLDPAHLDLPGFDVEAAPGAHLARELDIWEDQLRAGGAPDPVLVAAMRWLRANAPEPGPGDPVVLVQGDTGPGNFLYQHGQVMAILDWELAHLGDPHDDLGWICVRDLQERFTDLAERFADYERAGGAAIDPGRLAYYRFLAQTRCAIGTLNGLHHGAVGTELANHLLYATLHLRALTELLGEVTGVDARAEAIEDPGPSPHSRYFDAALGELRDTIVPAAATGFVERRAKGLARIVKYLREVDRLGPAVAEAELADLRGLVGDGFDEVAPARRALVAALDRGEVAETDVAVYALRRLQRETVLMRPAMGALADRHHAPIRDLLLGAGG